MRVHSLMTTPHAQNTGRLRALEVAEAAVLCDVSVGLCLMGRFVPAGGVLVAAAVTPFAAVTARHRLRASVAATMSAAVVALLAGGTGLATNALICATLGAVVGVGHRRHWSLARTMAMAAALLWPVASAITVGALLVLSSLRELILVQFRNSWR